MKKRVIRSIALIILGIVQLFWLNINSSSTGNDNNSLPQGYLYYSDAYSIRKIPLNSLYETQRKKTVYDLTINTSHSKSAYSAIEKAISNGANLLYPNISRQLNFISFVDDTGIIIKDILSSKTITHLYSPQNGSYTHPAFSNHTTSLAFLINTPHSNNLYDIGLIELPYINPVIIASHLSLAAYPPSWSPDDKYLAITAADSTIWIITPDGKKKWYVGKGFGAAWAPDGKRIICYRDKKSIIAYAYTTTFKATKPKLIYRSHNIIETFLPPVSDESGRYLFLHFSGYPLLSFFGIDNYELGIDYYHLALVDLKNQTKKSLMGVSFPPWEGFAYYPAK
ncbi:MAG: TolB family protein [bacterium]